MRQTNFVVADRTVDRQDIEETIENLQGCSIQQNFNASSLPDVICPWGCWEFVERCNSVNFVSILPTIDPNFKHCNNLNSLFRSIVPSFPEGFTLLGKFHIRPSVRILDNGDLVWMTCAHHRGDSLQYVHSPRNPVLNSVSSNRPERIALTQQQLHVVRTGKPKYNSHSSHLIEERGSYDGISTSTLHFPTFLNKGTELDGLSESVIAHGRTDIYELIQYYLDNHMIDDSFVDYLFNTDFLMSKEEIACAVKSATTVSLYDSFKMQISLNSGTTGSTDDFLLPWYAQPDAEHCEHGCKPIRRFKKSDEGATVLEGLARFSPMFLAEMIQSENSEVSQVGKVLRIIMSSSSLHRRNTAKTSLLHLINEMKQKQNSMSFTTELMETFLQNAGFPTFHVETRSFSTLKEKQHDVASKNVIFVLPPSRSERDCDLLPNEVYYDGSEFKLKFLSRDFSKGEFYCRHSGNFPAWFDSFTNQNSCTSTTFFNFYNFLTKGSWDLAFYERVTDKDSKQKIASFLKSMGGQNSFFCHQHNSWLIQNKPSDTVICFQLKCGNKGKWVCPTPGCTTAICSKHFQLNSKSHQQPIASSKVRRPEMNLAPSEECHPTDNSYASSASEEHSSLEKASITNDNFHEKQLQLIFNPTDFLTMSLEPTTSTHPMSTNAGVEVIDFTPHNTCTGIFPTKVLLNNYLNILQRTKVPLWTNNSHKHFLQNIVARIPHKSVPLLYPEALLFPSIFWRQESDGASVGALPSFLLQSDSLNQQLGFASVTDHLWTRLANGSLQTSSNINYASFAFDIKMNQELNKSHSNYIVFKRGFEDQLGDDDGLQLPSTSIKWDGLDSSKRVQEVAAACAEKSPDYFLTMTCNMSKHFGMQPLFEAIKERYSQESNEVYEAVVQSFMGLFVRMWERVSSVVMTYIEKSSEQPLGNIQRIWWRYEFQTTQGNLPHIHCLLWTDENKDMSAFQDRIVAQKSQLLFNLESQNFREIGLLKDKNDAFDCYKEAVKIHYHSCAATNYRCHKRVDSKGKSFCRYPVYPPSMSYYHSEIDVNHSDEAFQILHKCGLAKEKEGFHDTLTVTEELQAGQWFYPSRKNENMTPMNPHLFALTGSQNNLLICDKYLSARYIAKYAAGAEEKARVLISAGTESNQLSVSVGDIENNKIASVKHRLEKETGRDRKQACQAKHICITECYWHLFDLPFFKSSFASVCINTSEMESRPRVKHKQLKRVRDETSGALHPPIVNLRRDFPQWRQFTFTQKKTIELSLKSNISVDNVTAHSARPPELLFVRNPRLYFWLFERENLPDRSNQKLHQLLTQRKMIFIDGFNRHVVIRKKRLPHFVETLNQSNHPTAVSLRNFLQNIDLESLVSSNSDMRSNAVVYFTKTYPSNPTKFLIHLLISMGNFDTEIDLFESENLFQSFLKAGLWQRDLSPEQNVVEITRKYILEEAQFLPGSTRMFDKNVVQCYNVLVDYFQKGEILNTEPPRVLLSAIQQTINDKTNQFLLNCRSNTAKGLVSSKKIENCPSELALAQASTSSPASFQPTLTKLNNQSQSSYDKQCTVLASFIAAVDTYRSGTKTFIPHHFVLRRPGTGKSTVTLIALCYAMSHGLNCIVTTLAGEKASQFGGIHLHRLIPMPVGSNFPVVKQVESTVQKLYRDPMKLVFIKILDVLVIEELGMLNSTQ